MRKIRALLRHTKGAALPMLAAGLLPAIGAIGSAIDMGRVYLAKSALQAGVDAAALAGARSYAVTGDVPNSRDAQVAAYFYGNFPRDSMGSTGLVLTPTFTTVNKRNQTNVTATVNIPMTFMRAFGVEQQKISAVATAEIQPHPLEIMMVLDNTGSLKADLPASKGSPSKTRITALKDASKSFLDILYQGADNRDDLALGFVMYDITANVGKLLPSSMVRQRTGFNDILANQHGAALGAQALLWKGCVFGDATVRDLGKDVNAREPGAWDVDRTLPGEGGHPLVEPYFVPPFYTPRMSNPGTLFGVNVDSRVSDPKSDYYKFSGGEADYNLYKLPQEYASEMLNTDWYRDSFASNPYRRWFYEYYLGLNSFLTTSDDDVITRVGGGYYNPLLVSWDFTTNRGTPFEVHYERIPRFQADWKDPVVYNVNPQGGSTNNGNANKTEVPSPNWQCPEEAEPVTYGRSKAYWTNVVEKKNAAIYPANGTLHHAGLLWGYRLLVRDDVFKRTNPVNEDAKRALVFMTDGETALGTAPNGYANRTWTFYGNYGDAPISKNVGDLTRQSELRFSKTCNSLQKEKNPPKVYIVALTTNDKNTLDMFEQCAPGHVYRTSDAATLKAAFEDIASELVDLHLVK
ncbi:TadE/TadG family type IV pilus assembly protein [Sphingomonas sp. Mn802worker]|uniref:TadE/TadG family type IV pilus assembly protein n=1 Tax=Sphingomonas sp. Mn802worker TaxID=629773 RepID=UPI000372C355|nr:TadE/TadG family type IV pilus assembly protein [Sphingomonas sp. Mn802worker]